MRGLGAHDVPEVAPWVVAEQVRVCGYALAWDSDRVPVVSLKQDRIIRLVTVIDKDD